VVGRPLSEAEMAIARSVMADEFGTEFRIEIAVRDSLPRTAAGKLRAFVCDLPSTN